MIENTIPEILRVQNNKYVNQNKNTIEKVNLANTVLTLKNMNINDVINF